MRFSLMSSKLLPSQKQLKTMVLSSKEVRRIFGNPHERKFAELYETIAFLVGRKLGSYFGRKAMKETILDEASESFTEAQRMLKLKYTSLYKVATETNVNTEKTRREMPCTYGVTGSSESCKL